MSTTEQEGNSGKILVIHLLSSRLPHGSAVKNHLQCSRIGDSGWEDLLKEEMATHSSILAGKIPWTEWPGKLQFIGSQRVRHN